jgi:predicted RecA/RadA family phage recombinase
MKNFKFLAAVVLAVACVAAQAVGVDVMALMSPEAAMGLTLAGSALTTTFVQEGETLTLTPGAAVANGAGYMFGAGLFGVALTDVANGVPGPFLTEGVVTIAKTNALAIAVGDRVFWVPGTSKVDKTAAAQVCVGVAVEAAANPSDTVKIKLGRYLPVAV